MSIPVLLVYLKMVIIILVVLVVSSSVLTVSGLNYNVPTRIYGISKIVSAHWTPRAINMHNSNSKPSCGPLSELKIKFSPKKTFIAGISAFASLLLPVGMSISSFPSAPPLVAHAADTGYFLLEIEYLSYLNTLYILKWLSESV